MPLGANKAVLFGMGGVSAGDVVLLATYTASGEAAKTFEGFSSDYKQLVWQFINLHGSATDTDLTFRTKVSGGSYGISTQSNAWRVWNRQTSGSGTQGDGYQTNADANQSTGQIPVTGADLNFTNAEYAASGYLVLYNPTSTVYYKNWIARGSNTLQSTNDPSMGAFQAGYILSAPALYGIEFKFDAPTANIDTGKILYWGVK